MADTIVNTPQQPESDSSGWAIAVIILILVIIVGGYFLWHYRTIVAAPQNPGTNINVTIPAGNGAGTPAQ